METAKHKRRRIILLFVFGIALPCFLLGYLAYRGIQNDQALLERETLNQHRRFARQITQALRESFLTAEHGFLRALANRQTRQEPASWLARDTLKIQFPAIEEIFLFDPRGSIQLPVTQLLFTPDGSAPSVSAQPRSPTFLKLMQEGQHYEFQENAPQKALAIYRQALAHTSHRQTQAEWLNAMARAQTKLVLFTDALQSYQKLAQDYSQISMASGMPFGLAARLELGSLFLATKDSLRAIQTFLELYKNLLNREWVLEKSPYEFFAQQITAPMEAIFSHDNLSPLLLPRRHAFQRLQEQEKQQREATTRLLLFQEKAGLPLLEKISRLVPAPLNSDNRFALEIDRQNYLVSLPEAPAKNGGSFDAVWGLSFNPDYLKAQLLPEVVQKHISSENIGWVVKDNNDERLMQSEEAIVGTATIKSGFEGSFPPWTLELYQKEPQLLEALFASRRSIYFYIFLLIAGILGFGLALTLRSVNRELELAKLKSDFVSTVSHEFKSPLTAIRQYAEMLQAGRVPSESRRRQYYDVLVEQSERLSILIDNVLDFARMEEGRKMFAFEPMDISGLLREIVARLQHSHEGFQIHAQIPEPLPAVNVDRLAISQVLTNLLDNAIKYSGDANRIEVRAFAENQHLVIAVQDYGIGIAKKETDKIFERFYRGSDQHTHTVKGTGLGLTLVKQIVEAHRGTVEVESEPGQGSTFSIRLPLS